MPSPYTLSDLGYLVAVADEGHVGRAAAKCFVTQPTLSMQLKKLEACLGVALFERDRKKLVLTEVGRIVVEQARRTLAEAQLVKDIADAHQDLEAGSLRLGVIATLGAYLLPWAVKPLKSRFPRMDLVVTESITDHLLEMLREHRIDAILVALPLEDRTLEQVPVFEEAFHLTCPAGHPLSERHEAPVHALEGENLLLLTEGHCLRDQALELCSAIDPVARSGTDFRATSLETLREMVASGLGLTLLPALAAATARSDPRVSVLPVASEEAKRRIGLAWRRSDPRAPLIRAVADVLRANLPDDIEAAE